MPAVRSGLLVWGAGGDYEISTAHITTVARTIGAALENPRAQGVYFIAEEEPTQYRRFVTDRILKPRDIRPDASEYENGARPANFNYCE